MSWLDNYRQAEFRGIPFFVPSSDNKGGRRTALFEFPNKDVPYVEDMGRKARQFSLEAVIVGEDYMVTRNELITALEKRGSGKLVHPYYGTLDVVCTDFSYRERSTEMRMVTFTMEFTESGLLQFPNTIIDTTGDVVDKKLEAIDAANAAYAEAFYAVQSENRMVQTQFEQFIETIDNSIDTFIEAKNTVSFISSFRRDAETLRGRLGYLALIAEDLALDVSSLLTFGTNENDEFQVTADNADDQLKEMASMFEFQPNATIKEDDPALIYSNYFQVNAVINALGLLSRVNFTSADEAIETQRNIFEKLEIFLTRTTNDELFTALSNLQTAVTRDLNKRVATLPRLAQYTPPVSLPALVISHELYGNVDFEQDLIERNHVIHPLFVQGGEPIEVLIYA